MICSVDMEAAWNYSVGGLDFTGQLDRVRGTGRKDNSILAQAFEKEQLGFNMPVFSFRFQR